MGINDKQIKERIKADNESFANAFTKLAGSVMGGQPYEEAEKSVLARNAVEDICKFYGIAIPEVPSDITAVEKQTDYILRHCGLSKRVVSLKKGWYKNTFGAFLGSLSDGTPIALTPRKSGSYCYYDYKQAKSIKVTSKTEISQTAYCFYKPLPAKPLKIKDFILYIFQTVNVRDFVQLGVTILAVSLVGLITPFITERLFGNVLKLGNITVLLAAAAVLFGTALANLLIGIVKVQAQNSISKKAKMTVGAAMYMRVLSLKTNFFRQKPAGEISSRMQLAESLCDLLVVSLATAVVTALFSFIYVGQIFTFAPALLRRALIVIGCTVVLSIVTAISTIKYSRELTDSQAVENGFTMSLFSGIQKIKLAGAEKRAFAKWSNLYSKRAKLLFLPPVIIKFEGLFSVIITSVSTFFFYMLASRKGISVAEYMAFFAAFGLANSAFLQLTAAARSVAQIQSILGSLTPILSETPETAEGGTLIESLDGNIEINNVSFRYADNLPIVLDNISLKIKPGEYVAICGTTGCGKTTLLRILLGFETPTKGAVYYDGKDLVRLDKHSMRKNAVGVVMQNGSLLQGNILSNIILAAPHLTVDDAWEAAEIAGIADDIRAMPMGMYTMISEGQGGVSGGQKQRLMIARAVASKPKILILDEATSALDNVTQKHVSQSLAALGCTRIVIAHRLSTIKNCDRIVMLDEGKIAEQGTYEELISSGGAFAEMVRRQQLG